MNNTPKSTDTCLKALVRKSLAKIKQIEGLVPLLILAIIGLFLMAFNDRTGFSRQVHTGPFIAMLACIALLVLIGKASKDRPGH